jgi:hypothetical protein
LKIFFPRFCSTGEEAHTMLADIYGWFAEVFNTADLKDAKSLLDELSPGGGRS